MDEKEARELIKNLQVELADEGCEVKGFKAPKTDIFDEENNEKLLRRFLGEEDEDAEEAR